MGSERIKVTGGCACGEIRFGFYEPLAFKVACHCRTCQYTSGGGPAYTVGVARDQFRVTRGRPVEYASLAESGHLVTRAFCGNCGTHLYAYGETAPTVCSVKVGALDDPKSFRPKAHLWTSEAQPWHRKHRFTRRFRRNAPFGRRAAVAAAEDPPAAPEA